MNKITASSAILEQLARENRRVLSRWRAFLLLRRATFRFPSDARRWAELPREISDLHPLLRQMVARGEVVGVPKLDRIYQVAVPYAGMGLVQEDEILMEVHPYTALSHISALVFHGLTDDLPKGIMAAFPAKHPGDLLPPGTTTLDWEGLALVPGRRPDKILRSPVQWIRVSPGRYFGFREYQPNGYPVRVMTPERALVDGLQDPELCGGFDHVLQAWVRARDTLDLPTLVAVVDRLDVAVLRQRVGFILDRLHLSHPDVEGWRALAHRGGSSKLVGSAPYAPNYCERWNLSINAPITALSDNVA